MSPPEVKDVIWCVTSEPVATKNTFQLRNCIPTSARTISATTPQEILIRTTVVILLKGEDRNRSDCVILFSSNSKKLFVSEIAGVAVQMRTSEWTQRG